MAVSWREATEVILHRYIKLCSSFIKLTAMQSIEGKLFSPFQKKRVKFISKGGFAFDYENEVVWENLDATVNRIRASDGFPVTSFRQLMDEVANVTISNKTYEMFYRGQRKDYKNNQATFYKERIQKSIIYPSICRADLDKSGKPKYSIKAKQIAKRYERLSQMIELVSNGRSYFDEYYYSLFQHYEILPTPLIDITQSLRVAASFALENSDSGYVYMFGLPFPNQSISYYSDLGMVLIKLQNMMPVKALRPRYQEGYLVGKFPFRPNKSIGDDLANRMVAKFFVDNRNGDFWDKFFQPMPSEVLYPEKDEVKESLLKIKRDFDKKYPI